MATNTFLPTAGNQAWDVASNWSLARVPQPTDDVVITGSATASLAITISATDPAYTVNSLTESTANPSALSEILADNGSLTVTGATNLTSGFLSYGQGANGRGATLALNTVVIANSGEIGMLGGAPATLSIGSVSTMGGISGGGSVLVGAGVATIGTVTGPVNVFATSSTVSVGSTSGTGSFSLGASKLNLATSTGALADTVLINQPSTIDLQSVAYQPGETSAVSLTSSSIFNRYSVTLRSASGQTLYTLQSVVPGGTNAPPPVVSLTSDGAAGTLVSLACYHAETLIAVPGGEACAADLAIGDPVLTASGQVKTIKWVGRRSYAGRFLRANPRAHPVRFRVGSLGNGLPRRDLMVSPEHAMLLDGLLIPARALVNGTSIVHEHTLGRIDYVHIELDQHDAILAEGAASETFYDEDSRSIFHNAAEFHALYPDAPDAGGYHARRVEDGFELAAIRRRLAAVARQRAA